MRVLAQRCDALSPSLRARLLRAADAPAALTAVIAARPWARVRPGRGGSPQQQVYQAGAWQDARPAAAAALHPSEAQAWLALLALVAHGCGGGCSSYARGALARTLAAARKLLTPRLTAALPALAWMARAAEEAAQGCGQGDGDGQRAGLVLTLLPPWRGGLLRDTPWDVALQKAREGCFGDTQAARLRAQAEATATAALWEESLVCGHAGDAAQHGGAHTAAPAPCAPHAPAGVRVDVHPCSRAAPAGWHFELTPDHTRPGEPVTVHPPAGAAQVALQGVRWRLLLPACLRRLVPDALLRCRCGGAEAAALLALPAPRAGECDAHNAWQAAPHTVWVTLGALQTEGFALQLRCARVNTPQDVGLDARGVMLMYRPAGGAITWATHAPLP